MLNWIFWAIPREYVKRYFITLWLVMFIIPNYIFGLYFTKIGFIINLLWYDMIFYGWVRVKQTLEGDKK
tara:strand:+ start:107 stop:313 length:207 start_codon:yes stop_codon:yes gene_type:complete